MPIKYPKIYYSILGSKKIPKDIKSIVLKDIRIMHSDKKAAKRAEYTPGLSDGGTSRSDRVAWLCLWNSTPSDNQDAWIEAYHIFLL